MSHNLKRGEWISWEQSASPFLLGLTLNAGMQGLRGVVGLPLWTTIILFEGGQAKWLFRPQELKALGLRMVDYLLFPPFRADFETAFEDSEATLLREAQSVQFSAELENLGDDALVRTFQKLSSLYYQWYTWGWFCEPVQFQAQDLLSAYLSTPGIEEELDVDITEAKRLLLSLDIDSFTVDILEDLRDCGVVLAKIIEDANLPGDVRSSLDKATHRDAAEMIVAWARSDVAGVPLLAALQRHCTKFYWKKNNYSSTTIIDASDVVAELMADGGRRVDQTVDRMNAELKQLGIMKLDTLPRKGALLSKLPRHIRQVVALANSVGGILIDRRKRSIMIANGAFEKLLAALASRTAQDISAVRFILPQEFEFFLKNAREYPARLVERRQFFAMFQGDLPVLEELIDGFREVGSTCSSPHFDRIYMRDPYIAEGAAAEVLLRRLNQTFGFLADAGEDRATYTLQGAVAFAAGAEDIEGPVCVIKDPKSKVMLDQYILVAPSTTPDYMDAIRHCKAIVTDWGGYTSHAAIAARELNKPCIVGTGFASHVLIDGQVVHLNMRDGRITQLACPQTDIEK